MAIRDMEEIGTVDLVNLIVEELISVDELGHKVQLKEDMNSLLDEEIGDSVVLKPDR